MEELHAIRSLVRDAITTNESIVKMAWVAKNSSTRAYAGHSSEMRHVFDIKKVNLTEFARSFALYKDIAL